MLNSVLTQIASSIPLMCLNRGREEGKSWWGFRFPVDSLPPRPRKDSQGPRTPPYSSPRPVARIQVRSTREGIGICRFGTSIGDCTWTRTPAACETSDNRLSHRPNLMTLDILWMCRPLLFSVCSIIYQFDQI